MNVSDEEWLRKEGDGSKSIHLGAKKRLPEIFRGFLILPSWLRLMHLSHFSALPADTLRQHIVFFMRAKCQSCAIPPESPDAMLITPLQLFAAPTAPQRCYLRGTLPHLPRSRTFRVELIELHLVFERVHGREEALVRIRQELLPRNQAPEGFNHEFLAIMDIIEDLPTQHKVAAIDAQIGIGDRPDVGNHTVGTHSDRVIGEIRFCGEEARRFAPPLEHID